MWCRCLADAGTGQRQQHGFPRGSPPPGPLVTLLEGQFSLVGRQAYSAKAGAEYLNRRREDVSDFADVVENRTDFGIFERAPQPWDQLRRVSGNLLGNARAAQLRSRRLAVEGGGLQAGSLNWGFRQRKLAIHEAHLRARSWRPDR